MKLPHPRQFLHLAAGAAALPVSRFAWAQAYPTRPVRVIVPFGRLQDAARKHSRRLSPRLTCQRAVRTNLEHDRA